MFSRRTFCLEGCYTYTQLPTPKSLQHGVALPRHIYIYIYSFFRFPPRITHPRPKPIVLALPDRNGRIPADPAVLTGEVPDSS